MSAIGFIFLGIFLWIFYNLFVRVIWPVYKTARHLRKQFRNMADRRDGRGNDPSAPAESATTKEKVGEYIEFEELK